MIPSGSFRILQLDNFAPSRTPTESPSVISRANHTLCVAKEHVTRQAIYIVTCYILCWTPYNTIALWAMFNPQDHVHHMFGILSTLLLLNAVINPLIYGSFANVISCIKMIYARCARQC